jgi:low affinity Fe/Cu permease
MAGKAGWLERASGKATLWAGSSTAFALACASIIIWAVTGPMFDYSNTWQLVINTGTTIVTFLMVFLIQRSQNKDSLAIHLKLNELVAAVGGASNRLISAEDLTETEVKILREHFRKLVELAKLEEDITCSHSIEEAEADHARKRQVRAEEQMGDRRAKRRRKRGRAKRKAGCPSADTAAPPPDQSNNPA